MTLNQNPGGARRAVTRTKRALAAHLLAPLVLMGASAIIHADDGDPDTTFSGDGKAIHAWPTSYAGNSVGDVTTRSVASFQDGSIVIAGTVDVVSSFDLCGIVRFKSNGSVDTNFGSAGSVFVDFGDPIAKSEALGIFAAPADATLIVGVAETMARPGHRPALAKLLSNGQLDTSFGVGGRLIIQTQPYGVAAWTLFGAAAMAPDGKILLAGTCDHCGGGSSDDFVAVRLNANGTVDSTFGTSGWVRFGRKDGQNRDVPEVATSVAIDTQGRVVLGGYSEAYNDNSHQQKPLLVRFTATGQLDTTFNGSGALDINLLGSLATSAVAIDAYNDGIIVATNITNTASVIPGALIVRVKRDGVVDTSFGGTGLVAMQYDEGTNITDLAVRRDRRIVAAGWIDPVGPDTRDFFAARTYFYGNLDTSFDGNGVSRYSMPFAPNSIDIPVAISLSAERPVIAGTLYDPTAPGFGTYATGVLRLKSEGIFENDFD